jgi:protein-tyrosine phosphatase
VTGRIDVHGHLLPGLDDGSTSYVESIEIARRMAQAGYSHLSCTPHIWPGKVYTPDFIVERVTLLQTKLDEAGVAIKLIAGGELNLVDLDLFSMADDEIPTYGMARRYVLFDFWDDELPSDYWKRIGRLRELGATPVQAHPERIAAFQYAPELLDELTDRGVLLQGNLQCFSDKAGSRMRALAERLLSERRYFVLGSDLHRLDTLKVRLEGLKRVNELVGTEEALRLTSINATELTGIGRPNLHNPRTSL